MTFVLHEIKETFSYQNAVIKLDGRSALRTESALITLGPLANQLQREGLGLESLSVVTCEGLRRAVTPLTLLLLECSSKEANGRGVQRCRWLGTPLDGVHRSLKQGKSVHSFCKSSSKPPWVSEVLRTHPGSIRSSYSFLLFDWVLEELAVQKTVALDPKETQYSTFS